MDAEQSDALKAEALRGLRSLKVLLGTDSPEVRGWAPAVQQAAQRTVNAAIRVLAAYGVQGTSVAPNRSTLQRWAELCEKGHGQTVALEIQQHLDGVTPSPAPQREVPPGKWKVDMPDGTYGRMPGDPPGPASVCAVIGGYVYDVEPRTGMLIASAPPTGYRLQKFNEEMQVGPRPWEIPGPHQPNPPLPRDLDPTVPRGEGNSTAGVRVLDEAQPTPAHTCMNAGTSAGACKTHCGDKVRCWGNTP